jgi:hypothetical protein
MSNKRPKGLECSFSLGGGQFRLLIPRDVSRYLKMVKDRKYEAIIDVISLKSFKVIVKERNEVIW